jgi:hypothetical protein
MKFCVDCKHHDMNEWDWKHLCVKYAITNPVTGVGNWGETSCELARSDKGYCKVHGVHWEEI